MWDSLLHKLAVSVFLNFALILFPVGAMNHDISSGRRNDLSVKTSIIVNLSDTLCRLAPLLVRPLHKVAPVRPALIGVRGTHSGRVLVKGHVHAVGCVNTGSSLRA